MRIVEITTPDGKPAEFSWPRQRVVVKFDDGQTRDAAIEYEEIGLVADHRFLQYMEVASRV